MDETFISCIHDDLIIEHVPPKKLYLVSLIFLDSRLPLFRKLKDVDMSKHVVSSPKLVESKDVECGLEKFTQPYC
jgi:hypothetical protein